MDVSTILGSLRKVRSTGDGRWTACCPAHEDRSPSLAIREDRGMILLHCFGGCSVDAICGAIGISVSDLFPAKVEHEPQRARLGFSALDALRCLSQEAAVVAMAAADLAEGRVLSKNDVDRVATAAGRIATALEVVT